ncbi:MAG TPA: hypothetical protein VKA60_24115 [Blastocatellia bacterium]|nr:hypothetical protein [Blastocatellia bacterium]
MPEQFEGYEISLSRTPDGTPIVTTNSDVPLANECMVGTLDASPDLLYIHLDVMHDGKKFPVWVCQLRDSLKNSELEAAIIAEHGPEIVAAVKKMEVP